MNLVKLQLPEGMSEVSHEGIPYSPDAARQITVPEDVAPFILRHDPSIRPVEQTPPPATQAAPPNPAPSRRAPSTSEA